MNTDIANRFQGLFGVAASVLASAPGRLEVLGNHTDYNAGLTLSCAVDLRCNAALARLDGPVIRLASTAFDGPPSDYALPNPQAEPGHWTRYILGLVGALAERGHAVPGFALLIDSQVPRSAGVSSSAAIEMAALTGLVRLMDADLPAIELARIGQQSESRAVGANTGLLDQLTSLCGRADHLLRIDFQSLTHETVALPPGFAFVAIDSGVKHDLTAAYNDRRASCEAAAKALGVPTLRQADGQMLDQMRGRMPDDAWHCAKHIIDENQRVRDAVAALAVGDARALGDLLFASHASSQQHFRNSCPELDELIGHAKEDGRCLGARLSGGGFGGISIHLVAEGQAEAYRRDTTALVSRNDPQPRWSAVCKTDSGAAVQTIRAVS